MCGHGADFGLPTLHSADRWTKVQFSVDIPPADIAVQIKETRQPVGGKLGLQHVIT